MIYERMKNSSQAVLHLQDTISDINPNTKINLIIYYYDARNISEIQNIFNDIAKQVGGQTFSIIKVAYPVDVTVRYNGETLSSAEDNLNTRTSFGTLTFEIEENEIKMLRLNEEADYAISAIITAVQLLNL